MKRQYLIAIALVLASAGTAGAQGTGSALEFDRNEGITRAGTRGANFLEIGVGARAQALAGAYTALAEGVSALYWNTSALAREEGFRTGFSHTSLFEGSDIDHEFFGAALPTGYGTLGASVIFLSSGDMVRTTEEFPLGGDPEAGGEFEWTSTAVGLHFARQITDRLAVGAAGKFITEGIAGASADFFGVDLSTIFDTGLYGVTIGASLSNLGTKARMEGQAVRDRFSPEESEEVFENRRRQDIELLTTEFALPTTFRLGITTELIGGAAAIVAPSPTHSLRVLTDFADAIDTDVQTRLALEYSLNEILYLRGGKRWLNESRADHRADFGFGLSGGVGLAVPFGDRAITFDYGYVDQGDLNNIQVFTVDLKF